MSFLAATVADYLIEPGEGHVGTGGRGNINHTRIHAYLILLFGRPSSRGAGGGGGAGAAPLPLLPPAPLPPPPDCLPPLPLS